MSEQPGEGVDLEPLVARARGLMRKGHRVLLGIAGPPGSGKTTLAEALVAHLRQQEVPVAYLPMDGFHLADVQLERLGLRDRKGAPETFDAAGYQATLRRVASAPQETVYVPGFERDLEQPIAAALVVPPDAELVITEGNYLLLPDVEWVGVREWLAEIWYVAVSPELRRERLIARHVRFGKTPEQARDWVMRLDEANARLVEASAQYADQVIRVGSW